MTDKSQMLLHRLFHMIKKNPPWQTKEQQPSSVNGLFIKWILMLHYDFFMNVNKVEDLFLLQVLY